MRTHRLCWIRCVAARLSLALVLGLAAPVAAVAASYLFTTIDAPGAIRTEAYGISNAGKVVGYYAAYNGLHGFVFDGTGFTVIDVPPGPNTTAYDINEAGKIVGTAAPDSFIKDGANVSIIRYPGVLRDPTTIAIGINDLDHVVGRYIDADSHGFLKIGETYTRIAVPGASLTEPTGINNDGQIVGTYIAAGVYKSFLLQGGSFQDVAIPSATLTEAHGINSAGDIAGTFRGEDNVAHGFVLSGGTVSIIDVPGAVAPNYTQARGINDLGQVVGWFNDASGTHAFIATPQVTGPIKSLALKKSLVAGCKSVTGTVVLNAPAPQEGVVVTLGDTLASATVPATVKILSGSSSKSFTVLTVPVDLVENGAVSATVGSQTLSQALVVRPMGMLSLGLSPTSVAGGKPSTGTAKLECKAGPGAVDVNLGTSNAAVAYPVATIVTVPQGLQSAAFSVATNAVLARTTAKISGTANGITMTKTLTVTPAATVSPTSLKFGSIVVGNTGGPLNATLSNKGAVPYTVNSISLTGTYASWFAQTNDCPVPPATLAADASCTISVTFKPLAVASKTAKLTIATSATSTPLSVSLSGTGM